MEIVGHDTYLPAGDAKFSFARKRRLASVSIPPLNQNESAPCSSQLRTRSVCNKGGGWFASGLLPNSAKKNTIFPYNGDLSNHKLSHQKAAPQNLSSPVRKLARLSTHKS